MWRKRFAGRSTARAVLLAALLGTGGCGAALLAGAGAGVTYTLHNVAQRTYKADTAQAENTARLALTELGFTIDGVKQNDGGAEIYASAEKLDLIVALERVTPKTTKVSVNARKRMILKDKATAERILDEMSRILGE